MWMVKTLYVVLSLLGGCALRTLLPYIVAGLNKVAKEGWAAWPRFEARYLSSFILAAIGYTIVLGTVPGVYEKLLTMGYIQIVALAYAGQDLTREAIKLFTRPR
jgi:hypothetical protein